ncbi:MAG: hypothetical protein IJ004_06185 [Clostridia bacterium]|nr:hypothetical protein [Clostridia bacterium]
MSKCECKNCVHEDVCKEPILIKCDNGDCDHYKDKSLFVELPVRVGQTVYRIANYGNSRNGIIVREIEENQVVAVYYQEEIESQYKDKCKTILFDTTYADEYRETDIGDIVFLDRAEAERKLSEVGE